MKIIVQMTGVTVIAVSFNILANVFQVVNYIGA